MPVIKFNSGIFDAIEDTMQLPTVALDYQSSLDLMASGSPTGDAVVLQLSAGLIRMSQELMQWTGSSWTVATLELRISGAGLSPVSTLDALIDAINSGFATGTLNKFEVLRAGVDVLTLSMAAGGYVLTSGAQSVHLDGHLPLTFAQIFDMAGLINDLNTIQEMTDPQRTDLFNQLAAYSVSGLSVINGTSELFGFHIGATAASMTLNGLTITLTGTFPANLGQDMELLWQISQQLDHQGDIDFAVLGNLAISGLRITDAAGHLLGNILNPTSGTAVAWKMDGNTVDQVVIGAADRDIMMGDAGAVRSALAGLAGNDALFGGAATDRLYGGSGNDDLDGGAGVDWLYGGAGRDLLTGGGQADHFVFTPGSGVDILRGFEAGVDIIHIAVANRLRDLTFTDTGTDVRVDFNTIHFVVEDITIAQLRADGNFAF